MSNSAAQPFVLLNDPLVHPLVAVWSANLVQAYDRMLQYTEQTLNSVVSHSESALAHALENAKDNAIKLGETFY